MTSVMRQLGLVALFLSSLGVPSAVGQVYDLAHPLPGVRFNDVFSQVAEGLEYTEDGDIVRSPGKRMPYNESTHAAFLHYVSRNKPTVTVTVFVPCGNCKGNGTYRGTVRRDVLDLGVTVDGICSVCNGRRGDSRTLSLTVTYGGQLPPMPKSPKIMAFERKVSSAERGDVSAQLEVAKAFLDGKIVPRSIKDALRWLTEASKKGDKNALTSLARLYLDPANAFHDHAFGLALSAVADPTLVRADGPDFVTIADATRVATDPEAGLIHHLQVLEAGLLAPRIAQGLKEKNQADAVLAPDSVRKSFPARAPLSAEVRADKRALFVRGVARYLGHGFAAPDRAEALRLIEESACMQDADSFLMIALHYDTAIDYPASAPTAWAFYGVARGLGSTNPFCAARLSKFAETDVAGDWAGAPEALLEQLQQGRLTPAAIRDLADLSLYRLVRPAATASGAADPFDTAATQETPLSKAQVCSKARSLLQLKFRVVEASPDDECVFRKCWDDGTDRFYAVSGIVTFTRPDSRRETAPFTVCFKAADASSTPALIYCSAGSVIFGEYPPECRRRP